LGTVLESALWMSAAPAFFACAESSSPPDDHPGGFIGTVLARVR